MAWSLGKRRHLYVLLFAVPALLVSIIAGAMMLAASAGALWLFVFGDDPWPAMTNTLLGAVFIMGATLLWVALLFVAYTVGKQQEARPTFNTWHLALSIASIVVLVAILAVRLTGIRLSGPPSDTEACATLCRGEGFVASGMPPRNSGDRTCNCYDGQGRVARRIPLPTDSK